jgi:hypothetical protein
VSDDERRRIRVDTFDVNIVNESVPQLDPELG